MVKHGKTSKQILGEAKKLERQAKAAGKRLPMALIFGADGLIAKITAAYLELHASKCASFVEGAGRGWRDGPLGRRRC